MFNALASRDHQLEGLIVNGEHTFHAAAEGEPGVRGGVPRAAGLRAQLAHGAAKNSTSSPPSRTRSSKNSARPSASCRSLLDAAKPFAPQFDKFLTSLGPLTKAAKKGLPDVEKSLDLTVPVLENFRPVLHNLDPFLQYTGEYVPELQAFFANLTAATEASGANAQHA